jgi:hypothetical protein
MDLTGAKIEDTLSLASTPGKRRDIAHGRHRRGIAAA